MRHRLCLGVCIALIGCSSAPEKLDPTPLERIMEVIELDDVESIRLGGGDQTGLSPTFSDGVIAAASAGGEVYLLNQQLDELWNVDLDQTIVGGVGANATAVYVVTTDAKLAALSRENGSTLFEVVLPSSSTVPPLATETLVFVKTQIGRLLAIDVATGEIVWLE